MSSKKYGATERSHTRPEEHAGIRKIVEDLYPDSARFIYDYCRKRRGHASHRSALELSKNQHCLLSTMGVPSNHPGYIRRVTDIGEED